MGSYATYNGQPPIADDKKDLKYCNKKVDLALMLDGRLAKSSFKRIVLYIPFLKHANKAKAML